MSQKLFYYLFFPSLFLLVSLILTSPVKAEGYDSWGEVAAAMKVSLDKSYDSFIERDAEKSVEWVNHAYFQFYEKEGFERNVKGRVSGKRASQVEYKFAIIKQKIKEGVAKEEIRAQLDQLILWLNEDAATLDARQKAKQAQAQVQGQSSQVEADSSQVSHQGLAAPIVSTVGRDWTLFLAAFGTLLREGFEAILVIAAIAAYLTRSGNKKSVKTVYWASAAAVLVSALAAIALQILFKNFGGAKQEIIEGLTMLLATVVLFCVSNWMFAKAEAQAWKRYIENKVQSAVSTGSSLALAAAAFLAVFREGAETILFYQGILSEADGETGMVWGGFTVGLVALAAVFFIIRHGSMKLPIRPFFLGTSILMFVMSIAFAGGGIKELQEGDAISATMLEGFPTVELLGIYPTLQTLLPQLILVALTIFAIVRIRNRRKASEVISQASAA
ncbi:MAG: FTR1 family iron permease [Deltaproteobacteria bacterium]|jgi:high-affinity iron transporter|nr:FTR1 family iron permease [Deltaproteobacteria bacterium]